jgi:hypothetical protein
MEQCHTVELGSANPGRISRKGSVSEIVIRARHRSHGKVCGDVRRTRQWAALLGILAIIAALLRPGCDLLDIKGHAHSGVDGILSSSVDSAAGFVLAGLHAGKRGESRDDAGCCSSVDRFVLVSAQETQVPIFAKAQWTDLPPLAARQFRLVSIEMTAGRRIPPSAQPLTVLSYYARSARLLL